MLGAPLRLFDMGHHTPTTVDLALGELILSALKWIVLCSEFDLQRSALESQGFVKALFQISSVGVWDCLRLVAVNDNSGRIRAPSMGKAQLDPPSMHHRRLMFCYGLVEYIVQMGRR